MGKRIIIPDTNFLVECAKNKIDFFSEIDRVVNEAPHFVVLSCIVDELLDLEKRKGLKRHVSLAKTLIKNVEVVKTGEGLADDIIVDFAVKNKAVVCTQDSILKKRLNALGIPFVIIRQNKYLVLQ